MRLGGPGSAPRPLEELVALLEARGMLVHRPEDGPVVLTGIAMDSRRVSRGDLFAALPGLHHDGRAFAVEAAGAGAVAVLLEAPIADLGVPQVVVRSGRPALALASAWMAGFPSHQLGVVGVTGTDGKTTTAWLVRSGLERCGLPTGLVGTVDVVIGDKSLGNAARATTPEAPDLQGHLASMLDAGDRWAVVEATSHGLAQDRVAELACDVAVLTNVTQEHLEFHGTLEAYRAAKRRLFEGLAAGPANPEKGFGKHAVINADDGMAVDYALAARSAGADVLTYGTDPAQRPEVLATDVSVEGTGLRLEVTTPAWQGRLALRLPGRFNAHNALAALGVGAALGLDAGTMAAGLESVPAVPGRMQAVWAGQPFGVVVDYAHTAEALAVVLDELAVAASARRGGLVCVFGSAGDRDVVKRPRMGRVAGERCRLVILADEDPRGEDPMAILEAIALGAESAGKRRGHDLLLIPDRAEAIDRAMALARPGDIVLLAGKGHERSIELRDGVRPWDEAGAARAALARIGYGAADAPAGPAGEASGASEAREAAGEGGGR